MAVHTHIIIYQIKVLLGLIIHRALPTNAMRSERGLCPSYICSRRGKDGESSLHAIRDCPQSLEVWQQLHISYDPHFFYLDIESWLRLFATSEHSFIFLAAVWWCSRWRNQELLSGELWSISHVLCQVSAMAKDMFSAFSQPFMIEGCTVVQSHLALLLPLFCLLFFFF